MAEYTPYLNLKKPAPNEFYNVEDFNDNADLIDAEMGQQADGIGALQQTVNAHLAETVQNGVHGINEVQGETTFASTSGRTVSHSLGHTNYIVNVVPIQDTGGDLGDVFISKASNAFTIYNTGGFTGSFRYQLMT